MTICLATLNIQRRPTLPTHLNGVWIRAFGYAGKSHVSTTFSY